MTFDPQQRLADERHMALMTAITAVHDRLDLLNGRTRASETEIAVLRDRSARNNAIAISSLSSVIAAALYYFLR